MPREELIVFATSMSIMRFCEILGAGVGAAPAFKLCSLLQIAFGIPLDNVFAVVATCVAMRYLAEQGTHVGHDALLRI